MPILIGLITGFLLCIPIGPVNILIINTSIMRGFSRAISIALGDAIMNATYFLMITMGLTMVTFNEQIILSIKVVGIILITLLGIKELIGKAVDIEGSAKKKRGKKRNYFILGVAIYITNPVLIVTITGISTYIKSTQLFIENASNNIIFSISVAIGSMIWFILLLKILKHYKRKMTNNLLNKFNRTSGVLLIILAAYMSFKIL